METLSYERLNEILMEQYADEIRAAEDRKRRGEGVVMDKIVDFMNTPTNENLGGLIGEGIRSIGRDREMENRRRMEEEDANTYIYNSKNYI